MPRASFIFLQFLPVLFCAQIRIHFHQLDSVINKAKIERFDQVKSWAESDQYVRQTISSLRSKGYLLANVDSLYRDSLVSEVKVYFNAGKMYTWSCLKNSNVDLDAVVFSGYSERFFAGGIFNPNEYAKFMDKLVVYYENNGFPFAKIFLDSVQVDSTGTIKASLKVNRNKKIIIDSVIVFGDANVSKKFLKRYLELGENSLYNESVIRKISPRLRLLSFLVETKPVMVKLTDRTNRLIIFANKRNASQFDGIVGVLPGTTGKTVFTGDLKIKLINSVLKSGETLEINWRRLQTETQDLKTRIILPFLFNTPFGVEHNLKLYKRDSTFLDLNNAISANYFFSGLNNFKVVYKQRNTSVLSKSLYISSSNILELADIKSRNYGLGYFYESLDYKLNPRKGISVSVNATAGTRVIKKNPNINEELYSTIKQVSSQYQVESELIYFQPVFKKSTLKVGFQASTINSESIFRNELFRIGGLKTLRGFDEESIFSSTYMIGTLEYRLLFEQNSCVFLFSDFCWYEKNETTGYLQDQPLGVGAGINFETKAGIFSLTYALGNQFNNGFDIRSGKIHFGVVNSF